MVAWSVIVLVISEQPTERAYQGTTLEDVFEKDVSSPLWSASMIDKDPDAIVQAHSAFLVAGSDIILTAT